MSSKSPLRRPSLDGKDRGAMVWLLPAPSGGVAPGNFRDDAEPVDLPSCTFPSSIFLFFSLMQLLRQEIFNTHFVDCVQLAFQVIHVMFFVLQYFLK
jgi:hypothetical protein